MKKIYAYFFKQPLQSFICKCCFASLILMAIQLQSSAQDFTSISWGTAASQLNPTHEVHGEVVKGKLYIFGGYNASKLPKYIPTKLASVYDPVSNTWKYIADLPHTPNGAGFGGITHEGLTTDGTDIYIAGGYTSNSDGTGQLFGTKQVWKYNIANNAYSPMPNLPEALAAGQLRYLDGKLHYMGGANSSRADVGVHYVLDLNNLAAGWKSMAPVLNPTNHGGSAVYGGKIYYIGGSHHQDGNAVAQKTIEAYDPNTNAWTKLADMPVARDHISSAVTVIGTRILVLGGETSHNVKSKLVSAYSPATNTWAELTPLPQTKAAGVAAVLNGNIHYTGGNFSKTNYKGTPGSSENITLSPTADAFVRNGSYAATNYGNDTALVVKGTAGSGYTRLSYLKFSLGNISNISSAKLRIYGRNIDNTTAITLSSYGVNTDSWTESAITFNNAPAASTAALSAASVNNSAKYYELDVTSFVKTQLAGDKIVSLLIKDAANGNSNLVFNSKEETQNKPQLVITSSANRPEGNFNTPAALTTSPVNIAGIQTNPKKPFVYPNPSHDRFNIRFPANYEGNYSVTITDQWGRIYSIGKVNTTSATSDVDVDIARFSLRPGVYYLKINSAIRNEQIKVVIQ